MNNATMKKRDTTSNRGEIREVGIKNRLKIIVIGALLLATTNAMASIIFVPVGGRYTNPELAPVTVRHLDDGSIRVHTAELQGELSLKGSDFSPEYEVPASATGKLSFSQELDLVINLATGVVEGRASGQYINSTDIWDWRQAAHVQGKATCLPLNGRECGQLVVDLELRGVLTDPNDPSRVGQLQMVMLASLVWEDTNVAHWAAMSANTTIGGNEGLINSTSWEQGDFNGDGN